MTLAIIISIINLGVLVYNLLFFSISDYKYFYHKIEFNKLINQFIDLHYLFSKEACYDFSKEYYIKVNDALNDIYNRKNIDLVNHEISKYLEIITLMHLNNDFSDLKDVLSKFLKYIDTIPCDVAVTNNNTKNYLNNLMEIKKDSY